MVQVPCNEQERPQLRQVLRTPSSLTLSASRDMLFLLVFITQFHCATDRQIPTAAGGDLPPPKGALNSRGTFSSEQTNISSTVQRCGYSPSRRATDVLPCSPKPTGGWGWKYPWGPRVPQLWGSPGRTNSNVCTSSSILISTFLLCPESEGNTKLHHSPRALCLPFPSSRIKPCLGIPYE